MTHEERRQYILDAVRELAFAPAYLSTLARTSPLDDTPHLIHLESVAYTLADLTECVSEAITTLDLGLERERALLAKQTELRELIDSLKAELARRVARIAADANTIERLKEELAEKVAQIADDNNEILNLREAIKSATAAPQRVYVVLDELGRRLQVFGSKNNAESYVRGYGNDATVATWDIIT